MRSADPEVAAPIVAYSDYACPYSFLSGRLLARLEPGPALEHRAFELRPAPAPLPAAGSPELELEWETAVLPAAARLDIEIRWPAVVSRTRKAHEMAAYARSVDRFAAVHEALFRACFLESRDIGRMDVLLEVGVDTGLDPDGLHVALGIDQYAEAVAWDAREAAAHGITGVPTLRRGDELLVGLHPYEELKVWVGSGPVGGSGP